MRYSLPGLKALPLVALVATAGTAGLMAAAPLRAQTAPEASAAPAPAAATITVNGEGLVRGTPDMAQLSIGVTTSAETAADALAANSAALEKVIEQLKMAGIEERHLQTAGLSINPDWSNSYSSSNGAPSRISGYTASNMLNVRILSIGDVGAILDAAVATGANSINGPMFGLQDQRKADDEARKAAVADARVKAELLAEAMGMKLGAVVSVSEGGAFGGAPVPMYKADAASGAVPVQLGEIATQANVTVVWQLLP